MGKNITIQQVYDELKEHKIISIKNSDKLIDIDKRLALLVQSSNAQNGRILKIENELAPEGTIGKRLDVYDTTLKEAQGGWKTVGLFTFVVGGLIAIKELFFKP